MGISPRDAESQWHAAAASRPTPGPQNTMGWASLFQQSTQNAVECQRGGVLQALKCGPTGSSKDHDSGPHRDRGF
eukprot:3166999-Rhodomonas_salina.1